MFCLVKSKKKAFTSFLLTLGLLVGIAIPASAAALNYNCGGVGYDCRGVNVTNGTAIAYSDYVYAMAGQSLAVSNSSTGSFNLVTQLLDTNGNVYTPEIAYHQTVFAKVSRNGYYRVKVTCKDYSVQKRCSGFGQVSQ